MSDYHILAQNEKRKRVRVVFHIPIAATVNAAGITYREALVRELGGADAIISALPEVQGTQEETDMKAGSIFELSTSVRFSSVGINNATRLAEIEAEYDVVKAATIAEKAITLDFMGKEGDV